MRKKIVLIENNADACMLFTDVLSSAGYEVLASSDGKYILNSDNSLTTPDLYIFDNGLPEIDGVALTKYLRIKAAKTETPILIMSGNFQVCEKTRKAGASAFILKPFEVSLFLTLVSKLLSDSTFTYFPSPMKQDVHRQQQ